MLACDVVNFSVRDFLPLLTDPDSRSTVLSVAATTVPTSNALMCRWRMVFLVHAMFASSSLKLMVDFFMHPLTVASH